MELYQVICEESVKKYGTKRSAWLPILVNQYSDRTHFLYELLQNAEDAGATVIRFYLRREALEVYHNGRPFNEKDIRGVCSVADGTKNDGTSIGHFGIGFKSVYCYTDNPQIYSGQYHFVIHDKLMPEEVPGKPELAPDITCMILPFDHPEVTAKTAYEEIRKALVERINAETILMLRNLEKLQIAVEGQPNTVSISKMKNRFGNLEQGNVYALNTCVIYTDAKGNEREHTADYLYFTDDEDEPVALVYKTGGKDGKELCAVRNSKVYAFFPTAKESHQNFYIQAPFDTTPARDNFKEGAEYGRHNIELIENICDLICNSLVWMRDNGYLSFAGFNTVFPVYEYEKDDLLYAIYANSIDMIASGLEILPTNVPGKYGPIEEICVPESERIVDVFGDEELHRLISPSLNWLAKEISTSPYHDLHYFLEKNANFRTIRWKDLVLKMDANFLQSQSVAWLERLMSGIESRCIRNSSYGKPEIDVTQLPLVRVSGGRHVCARNRVGQPQVYLNNPELAEYKIEQPCLENYVIRRFYQSVLEIQEYNISREVLDDLLPKYRTSKVQFVTADAIQENFEDLKKIKDAISENSALLDKITDKYIVTDGKSWFTPKELYIPSQESRYGYTLINETEHLRFLSSLYVDDIRGIELGEEFYRKIGCPRGLQRILITDATYLMAVSRYCSAAEAQELREKIFSKPYRSEKPDWSFCYEGFPGVFKNMSKQKSVRLARFLNANAGKFEIKGNLSGATDQNFSGKNVDSCMVYTMIGLQLCFEKWIYTTESDEPKRPIDVDKTDLAPEYQQARRLIEMLPFKEVKNGFTDWVDAAGLKSAATEKLLKEYASKPEELARLVEMAARSKAKAEARKSRTRSVEEMLREGDRSQQEPATERGGFEVAPISARGLQRREENLDRILAETMQQKISVIRGLQFACRVSNEAEREFLLAEYDGYCQICGQGILRYDGKPYFEAINIIKTGSMMQEYEGSMKLGWNSLCLCPNCAAKYKYCSKKISTIRDQVMQQTVEVDSDEPICIQVEIPEGERKVIHYSPRHFMALKQAFKFFAEKQ